MFNADKCKHFRWRANGSFGSLKAGRKNINLRYAESILQQQLDFQTAIGKIGRRAIKKAIDNYVLRRFVLKGVLE